MRYLGVDYGSKKIGIAHSDENGSLAFPHSILPNNDSIIDAFREIIKEEDISTIVIGESLNDSGDPNIIMKEISTFKEILEKEFGLPVELEKEFLTSFEARRFQSGKKEVDASAAALILQRYLDRKTIEAKRTT
ncbi:Holliday junction resolvase RuvX [Candidatus Wolfebacteria bacterium]|nr:MAG: Holliday junction resolvase RuvX [Candidatus Wolfebacteria bacterium]